MSNSIFIRFARLSLLAMFTVFGFISLNQVQIHASTYENMLTELVFEEGDFDNYTNLETGLSPYTFNVNDYMNYNGDNFSFYEEEIEYDIQDAENTRDIVHASATGDDPIVGFIPREFFVQRGTYLYIGLEYGFVVKTQSYNGNYSNKVDVFVFDIDINYDYHSVSTPSEINYTLTPIFAQQFLFLTEQDNFTLNNAQFTAPAGMDSVIIPYISIFFILGEPIYSYSSINSSYFIKDVSVASQFSNEQDLNEFDTNYDLSSDMGSYITGTQIEYNGISGGDYSSIFAAARFVLGFTKLKYLVKLYTIADILIQLDEDIDNSFSATTEYYTQYQTSYFDSSLLQKQAYQHLVRVSATALTSTSTNPILVGVRNDGNYINFMTRFGTENDCLTRVESNISIQIANLFGTEIITASRYFQKTIGVAENKELSIGSYTSGYALDGGTDYFTFSPTYTSLYTISTSSSLTTIIKNSSGVQLASSTTGNLSYTMVAGSQYFIEVKNNTTSQIIFYTYLTVPSQSSTVYSNVAPGSTTILKYTTSSWGVKHFYLSSYYLKVAVYNSDFQLIQSVNSYHVYVDLEGYQTYYFVITNNYYQSVLFKLLIQSLSTTSLGTDYNISASLYGDFRTYQAPSDGEGDYIITVIYNQTVPFEIISQSYIPIEYSTAANSSLSMYTVHLNANQMISFGYFGTSGTGSVFSYHIEKSVSTVDWFVDGVALSGNIAYLEQNKSYSITVKLGNCTMASDYLHIASSYASIDNGLLLLNYNAPYNSEIAVTIITQTNDTIDLQYLYIVVLPQATITVTPNSSRNDSFGFDFAYVPEACPEDYCSNYYETVTIDGYYSFNGITVDFDGLVPGYYAPTGIQLCYSNIFVSLTIETVHFTQHYSGITVTADFDNSESNNYVPDGQHVTIPEETVNSLYYAGTGTTSDPFQITNERHLNNIRYATVTVYDIDPYTAITANYVVNNNITLTSPWVPIPNIFMGTFKGANNTQKTIFNVDITVSSYSYATGFFSWIDEATISYIKLGGYRDSTYNYTYNSTSNANVIGGLAGVAQDSTISNCIVYVLMTTSSLKGVSGGVVGSATNTTISYTDVYGEIKSTGTIGGIAGVSSYSTLNHVVNYAYIQAQYYNVTSESSNSSYGGIVGIQYTGGLIENSSSVGNVSYVSSSTDNRFLKPRMGSLIGTKSGGYTPLNCSYSECMVFEGTLHVVTYWFVNYDQAQYVGGTIGKTS